jgi:hypothetical protein
MATPFPFVAGNTLTAAQLNSIGEVLGYTPTTTNVTLGNGTLEANYVRVQNLIYVQIKLGFGSTTALTGQPTFTLPVAPSSLGSLTSNTVSAFFDAGVALYLGGGETSGIVIAPHVSVSSTAFLTTPTGNVSATSPFTWGNGDVLVIQTVYRSS